MEALSFINKFLYNIIEWIHDNDSLDPNNSLYKVFINNDLLLDKYKVDNKKLSQFILNPDNFIKSKSLFLLLDDYWLFLHYDDCDDSWVGDHLNQSDLTVKEQEVFSNIYHKDIRYYSELFKAFEQ